MKKAIALITLMVCLHFSALPASAYSFKGAAKAIAFLPFRTFKYVLIGSAVGIAFTIWESALDLADLKH